MKLFDTCTGIGGFSLAFKRNWPEGQLVGFSEIDKYAISIYQKHFPGVKNFGSVTAIQPEELPDFDILTGGFPCQAFSIAGLRKGFADHRGNIFFALANIMRIKRPRNILLENVKGLLSHDSGRTYFVIKNTLGELGYNTERFTYNSKYFGVPQNRERVYIVGCLGDGPPPRNISCRRKRSSI